MFRCSFFAFPTCYDLGWPPPPHLYLFFSSINKIFFSYLKILPAFLTPQPQRGATKNCDSDFLIKKQKKILLKKILKTFEKDHLNMSNLIKINDTL